MNAKNITLIVAALAVLAMASLFLVPVTDTDAADADAVGTEAGLAAVGIDYKNTEVTGEYSSKNLFDNTQIVTVKDYWTLINGAEVTIEGRLIVPEGTVLTVKSDAKLFIAGEFEIHGTLIIEEFLADEIDGGFVQLYEGSQTVVSGTVIIDGALIVSGKVEEQSGGSIVVEYDGILSQYKVLDGETSIHVHSGAEMAVFGKLYTICLIVDGKLVFDSEVPQSGSDIIIGTQGVIEFKEITAAGSAKYEITDTVNSIKVGLEGSVIDTMHILDKDAYCAVILKGLTIKGFISDSEIRNLLISGDVTVTYEYRSESTEEAPEGLYANATITNLESMTRVVETLILGPNVTLDNKSFLYVYGFLDATSGKVVNDGDSVPVSLHVRDEGVIKSSSRIAVETTTYEGKLIHTIWATRFVDGGFHYYMDINKAIKSAESDRTLFVLGYQIVKEDLTLLATNKLDLSGAIQLIVGDDQDDTLIIAEGATMTGVPTIEGDKIDVVGTLLIENQMNVPTAVKDVIASDVVIFELDEDGKIVRDGWAKYTNIRTALAEAEAGDHVDIMRDIVIDYELIIPEEVTLDTNKYDVLVKNNGGKITDYGTFYIDSASQVTAEERDGDKSAAEIVVYGFAKSDAEFDIVTDKGNAYLISGAYFSITDKKKTTWYVTPVDYAAEHVLTFDSIEVPAIGVPLPGFYVRANAAMVIGDITLSGESSSIQYVIMVVETNLDAGTITMETSIVHIQPDNEYTGAFTNGTGTLTVNGKIVKEGFAVGDDEGGDENNLLTTGDIVQPAVGVVTNLIYDGSAILAGEINADTVVINGEVYFVGGMDISEIQNLEVKGKMVVEDGINVITEYLDVKGDVEVQGGGFLHTEVMLVGVDKNGKSTIDSVPVVTGNILVYDYVLFAPDCVIPEYIAKDAGLRSTVFYGEGNKKIATAYAVPSTEAQNKNIKIVVENAWLNGWMEKNGMIVDDAIYGEYPEVFASIDYYIYHVTIVADYGVQNVAIDGVILPHGNISNNTYFIDLKTGIHTVTVTLASGYIGTAKLYIIQDEKPVELTASKFTAVGTPTTADGFFYELQVAGAEANTGDVIIHVDPSDPMVVIDKESNEWSVYTILMLVLVIVVGLVAVVLALRLHRS